MGFLKWLGSLIVFTILAGILSSATKAILGLLGFSGSGASTFALLIALVIGVVIVMKINGMMGKKK